MPLPDKQKGYLALLFTSFFWGTTWVVSKIGVNEIPGLQMSAIRHLIAGVCFVGYYLFIKKFPLPTWQQWKRMFLLAFLMFVMANGLSTWGLQYVPTGLGALIGALYPLSVVLIERIFLKARKISPIMMLGFALGLTGMMVVFYEHFDLDSKNHFIVGVALSVTAMLSWSVGSLFIARKAMSIHPYYGLGWQYLISACILGTVTFFQQDSVPISSISAQGWFCILYLALIGSVLAFIAFIISMEKLPVAIASLYAYINPLVAMALAVVLVNEPITIELVFGAIFTLTGVFLVNYGVRLRDRELVY